MTFTCAWRHPECADGPGPGHFRHVPCWEAAEMPDTPESYVLNMPWTDVRTTAAVLDREDVSDALVERLSRDLVHLAVAHRTGTAADWDGFYDVLQQIAAFVRLPRATAGSIRALLRHGAPLEEPVVVAIAASDVTDDKVADQLVDECMYAARRDLLALAAEHARLPYLKALADLVRLDVDVELARTLAPQLAAMDDRRYDAACELADGWSGPPGEFVAAVAALG